MDWNRLNVIHVHGSSKCTGVELLFGGDCCPCRNYGKKIHEGKKIFSDELERLFRSHEFSMINLESPLCTDDTPTLSFKGRGLHCAPEVASYLKNLHVDAVSIANNHILDHTESGLFQTIGALDRAGVRHAGAGENLAAAEMPLEIKCGGLKIGIWCLAEKELNCATEKTAGSSFFSPIRNFPLISQMRDRYDYLIIYIHAGHEFTFRPSPRIREAYRGFIDAGADLVIGHHPHVIEGVEQYGNGFIAYSLGNLVFDSDYVSAYPKTDLGYLVSVALEKRKLKRMTLIPYRLRDDCIVSELTEDEFDEFAAFLREISDPLKDDEAFLKEWEKDVIFRWSTYRNTMRNISNLLFDPDDPDYAVRNSNVLTCPTHLEMYSEVIRMWKEGKISRFQ
ncbi:MAG: CapA family protein [Lentisphaeria bacterium]|nr:CapA family protein [Lentisphaeria bacterium]